MQKGKIIGVCGLTLLGLMTLNAKTVHADVITWNNGNANNNALESNITSSDSSITDDSALESNIKASDSVKANNSVTVHKDIETSHVNANAPIQKTKVAQFNKGSEIYGLDNGNTLSKSNGAGYVITNAGTYNGRAVDIGVTINNVQDNQGSYTTKWSNGDKADVTGKVDNDFSYQNSVTIGVNPVTPAVPNKIRTSTETKNNTYQVNDVFVATESINDRAAYLYILDPVDLAKVLGQRKIANMPANYDKVLQTAGELLTAEEHGPIGAYYAGQNNGYYSYVDHSTEATHDITLESVPIAKFKDWFNQNKNTYNDEYGSGGNMTFSKAVYIFNNLHDLTGTYDPGLHGGKIGAISVGHGKTIPVWGSFHNNSSSYTVDDANDYVKSGSSVSFDSFGNDFNKDASYSFVGPTDVTDHLQLDQVNKGSLDYSYKVGVYDSKTGELIDDLIPVYKGKVGSKATSSDSGMNRAIKDKILQINNHQAHSAFTGSQANDDVVFYLETQAVQDSKQLTANASRVITFNLPSSVNKTNYARLVGGSVNGNQVDITDNLRFTRTGTTNLATNKTTYSNWNAVGNNDSFPSHTIVRIPGYTLTINK